MKTINDVKNSLENGFTTQAAKKRTLDALNRIYDKLRDLAVHRLEDSSKTWDIPFDLHQVRPKHYSFFDGLNIEDLVSLRAVIKDTEVTKKPKETKLEKAINALPLASQEQIKPVLDGIEETIEEQLENIKKANKAFYQAYHDVLEQVKEDSLDVPQQNRRGWINYKMSSLGYANNVVYTYCLVTEKQLDVQLEKDKVASLMNIKTSLVKKLNGVEGEITEIKKKDFTTVNGMVEGSWILKADKNYELAIETIIAGGYNIQCRHLRTLFKLMVI